MALLRLIRKRFWLCLGLAMVFAGGTAASVGYMAAREAKLRPAIVVTPTTAPAVKSQPTTKKSAAAARIRRSAKSSGATTRKGTVAAAAQRKPATTRNANAVIVNANAPEVAAQKWRGMMWWGGGALFVGLVSVAYSVHESRPKAPPSGADELLNDAPPF